MSKSLSLINGDLAVGAGRAFQTVSGREKLKQDLMLWVLEKVGTDPATPTYGNKLDGGQIDNTIIPTFIGQIVNEQTIMAIQSEVVDLVQRYQSMQYEKMRQETIQYGGPNTLEAGEVIDRISSVQTKSMNGTTVLVQMQVTTLTGTELKLTIPVTAGGTGA